MPDGIQHPVPPSLLVHIGDITVSFAVLESTLQSLIGSLLPGNQRIGQIVTAEVAFKNLRALAISLYREWYGEDDNFVKLRELMKRCAQAEETRNQITHSQWAVGRMPGTITRIKATAKEKRGIHFHFENMGERDLAAISLTLKTLAAEVQFFWLDMLLRRMEPKGADAVANS